MRTLFSRFSLVFAVLWAFSTSSVVGQITIDGTSLDNIYTNQVNVGLANVPTFNYLENRGTATIGTATVDGTVYNSDRATIRTATINGFGRIVNSDSAHIGLVTVDSDTAGQYNLTNTDGGTIGTAIINGGRLNNAGNASIGIAIFNDSGWAINADNATIGTATINNGGWLENCGSWFNASHAFIGEVTINSGGTLNNNVCATVGLVTVNDGGKLLNGGIRMYGDGTITHDGSGHADANINAMNLSGGTIYNGGQIDNMTYVGGTYNGRIENSMGVVRTGTIGTLTLTGDSANNTGHWGTVESLKFAENGTGIVSISAFTAGAVPGFTGLTTPDINFAFGNVSLNLSGVSGIADDYWASAFFNAFGYNDGFYLHDLLGASTFGGVEDLYSFQVAWDDELFWILNDGVFGSGWGINSVTG